MGSSHYVQRAILQFVEPMDFNMNKDQRDLRDKMFSPPPQPLSEKDFIQNKPVLKSLPFWTWLFMAAAFLAILLGMYSWYGELMQKEDSSEPFLAVTNREFSVFLWQFPQYLKPNAGKKMGYLPGFYGDKENLIVQEAEKNVSAPPDLLFLYHTWNRLLAPEYAKRPISSAEFEEFLQRLPEWIPSNWKAAPPEYAALVNSEGYKKIDNLETLTNDELPRIVRIAFQGWRNYYKEGPQINAFAPTIGQVKKFLENYPNYARNYWRNIAEVAGQPVAGLNYLSLLLIGIPNAGDKFPSDQLTPFLKAAMYNADQAATKLSPPTQG